MTEIKEWLDKFRSYWQAHDIKKVMTLFDKNVVYYETPFKRVDGVDLLAKEWEGIKNQKNISLTIEIFSESRNRYSVIFKLEYINKENIEKICGGTYLIELNDAGLCTYFHHSCESM
ncbi:MAG TPA: hypothetical protein VJA47_00265 [archaeon]|nr:hypothetical protein [archaeon]